MISDRTVAATFQDVASPVTTVTSPNGGETLTGGSTSSLTWTATDNAAVTLVDLELSRTGAGGPYDPIATRIANTGSHDLLVPAPSTPDALFQGIAPDAPGPTHAATS